MPSSARRRETDAPPAQLYVAPHGPSRDHPPHDAAQQMLKKLSERFEKVAEAVEPYRKLNQGGGHITFDRPRRRYDFAGAAHVNIDQFIYANLWRFKLLRLDRGVLDHMVAHHDEQGVVNVTQVNLAHHFECSQGRISKAISVLRGYHFIWMLKRGAYQVNPRFAYRFDSTRQRALIAQIGAEVLAAHTIEVPGLGRTSTW